MIRISKWPCQLMIILLRTNCISQISLSLIKENFRPLESSDIQNLKEEHGFIYVEISFKLNAMGLNRTLKRKASVNIVYNSGGLVSRTVSAGGRMAKIIADEICSTQYGGKKVGIFKNGKCQGYKAALRRGHKK